MSTSRRSPRPAKAAESAYVAVIADIVGSRRIVGAARRNLQHTVHEVLSDLNRRFQKELAARFVITVGDEFQGLLATPRVLPEILRHIEIALPAIEVRVGIGFGGVDTELQKDAIGMDGPVWHAAREAIRAAEQGHRLGGVFVGFGADDAILNGLARILHYVRNRLTPKQREIVEHLLKTDNQRLLAKQTGVSPQLISKQARASGAEAYREAEDAFRALLLRHTPTAGDAT